MKVKRIKFGRVAKKQVRKIMYSVQELKYYKAATAMVNAYAVQNTWSFFDALKGINIGNTVADRIGNKIYVESLDWYFRLTPVTGAVNQAGGTICRIIIYHDREANGNVPSYNDLFDRNSYDAFRQLLYVPRRATILMDKLHCMSATNVAFVMNTGNSGAAQTVSSGPKYWAMFKQKIGKVITYTGTAGTVADLGMETFGVGVCADGNNCCTLDVECRVRFRDA